MNTFLLIAVITANLFQSIFQKQYNKRTKKRGTYIFNSIFTLSACILFVFTNNKGFHFERALIPYILGFAVAFGSAILFTFLSIRQGSLSLTTLATSYSLIIPTLYGLLFLNENSNIFLYIGFALLVCSLFLLNSKNDGGKINLKWIIFVLIAFVGNGMCATIQTAQQLRFGGQYKGEFMISALTIVSIFFFMLSIIKEKADLIPCLKSNLVFMVLTGIANGLVNLFVMFLVSREMPTSIMFPIISGGGIVLTTTVSVIIYKEKLSIKQYFGLLLGIASVIFMNL